MVITVLCKEKPIDIKDYLVLFQINVLIFQKKTVEKLLQGLKLSRICQMKEDSLIDNDIYKCQT